jgi:hypothetical protein
VTALLTFATSNPWRAVALALGLLLALGFIRLEFAKASAERAQARLALCTVNVGTLSAALETQNKAVKALKDAADKEAAEAGERARRAREEADKRRAREAGDDRSGPERMNAFLSEVF